MSLDPISLRVGIVDQTVSGWSAAGHYSRMVMRSLEAAVKPPGVELCFFSAQARPGTEAMFNSRSIQLTHVDYLPAERPLRRLLRMDNKSVPIRGEHRLRKLLRLSSHADVFASAAKNAIDVLLPLLDIPPWKIASKTIGWIPDFQHLHLPEFFPQADLAHRNTTFKRVAERATVVMLSSKAALADFKDFAPDQVHKARVIPFPSLLAFDELTGEPVETVRRFNLPEKFALVTNQFWAHKNHSLVINALALLKRDGLTLPVVMTGLPSDHRDPTNKNFSALLQAIATNGLHKQVTILGLVAYTDLINLTRAATLIVQPSMFEGWSTVVQDAIALGRPLVCSDIPVHREQAPNCLGFFPTRDPQSLAGILASHWQNLRSGPDEKVERQALDQERKFSLDHGASLVNLCLEASTM